MNVQTICLKECGTCYYLLREDIEMKRIKIGLKDVFALENGEPVVKSFLDTDYYKFPMAYFIWKNNEYRNAIVTFELIIRDKRINPVSIIPESALREQLDECAKLRINQAESSFVGGMTMSDNQTHIIRGDFLAELQKMTLPPYDLRVEDGRMKLSFTGPWWQVTWWEIFALEVVSELYYYFYIKKYGLSRFEVSVLYSRMIEKLFRKMEIIKSEPGIRYILFDTRRRHSRYMQEFVFEVSREELPLHCIGTSNVLLSMRHGSANPLGTNAHELPMVKSCLAEDQEEINNSQYEIIKEWYDLFGRDLAVLLIDTYGTVQFLKGAPSWIADKYQGVRPDSMDPTENIDLMVDWWKSRGVDPMSKMVLPSDGLDAEEIVDIFRNNHYKVGKLSFGWGTLASNDCHNVWPRQEGNEFFRPFSIACKVVSANGVPAVKLSDNPAKATGHPKRVELFKKIFGVAGVREKQVLV
jgi:nicotinate phosphoribosyltransferase